MTSLKLRDVMQSTSKALQKKMYQSSSILGKVLCICQWGLQVIHSVHLYNL